MTEIEIYYNKLLISVAGINTWMMLLPIVVAIWQRRYLNAALRVFLYYCIASFLIGKLEQTFIWATGTGGYYPILKPYLDRFEIKNVNFLQILYVIKNYIFLGWFYSLLFPKKFSRILKLMVIILLITSLINYFFIEGYNAVGVFNSVAVVIFWVLVPAFYLWFIFKNLIYFPLKKNPYFWISFGLVSSNLITLFNHLIGDAIYQNNFILFTKIGIARNSFDILALILFSIAFWYASYAKFVKPFHHSDS